MGMGLSPCGRHSRPGGKPILSATTFTTVGYGDITLAGCRKLLSVGQSVNGVLMAGWSTVQLIFLVQRMTTINLHSDNMHSNNLHYEGMKVN